MGGRRRRVLVGLIAAWEAVPVAAGAAAGLYVPTRRYRQRRRLERTRANIAALERDLGYDVPLESRIERELKLIPQDTKPSSAPVLRIGGYCDHCKLYVAVNEGRCSFGNFRSAPESCAKNVYRTTGARKATPDD